MHAFEKRLIFYKRRRKTIYVSVET